MVVVMIIVMWVCVGVGVCGCGWHDGRMMAYLSSDEMRITRCELALTHVQCVNLPLLLPRCQWRHRWIWFHVVIGAMVSGVDGASGGSTGSASSILSVPVLILVLISV